LVLAEGCEAIDSVIDWDGGFEVCLKGGPVLLTDSDVVHISPKSVIDLSLCRSLRQK